MVVKLVPLYEYWTNKNKKTEIQIKNKNRKSNRTDCKFHLNATVSKWIANAVPSIRFVVEIFHIYNNTSEFEYKYELPSDVAFSAAQCGSARLSSSTFVRSLVGLHWLLAVRCWPPCGGNYILIIKRAQHVCICVCVWIVWIHVIIINVYKILNERRALARYSMSTMRMSKAFYATILSRNH